MKTKLVLSAQSYLSQETNLSSFLQKTGLNTLRTKGTLKARRILTAVGTDGPWSAYGAFVKFFAGQVEALGVTGTLEKYIFDPEVNKNGINMLSRVVSGA